ncbi:hypothetical protein RF11_06400 [Thelohanellus kitauei]|uniref:Reverse transcriptase domain-containing protein n=1 Tax=Thelohanellus kitauei TaxID=669202 RepID=A0A0C2MR51_THEKT|nr:hypothetical protein RF11_06400 [Thelohanellus kitauei]
MSSRKPVSQQMKMMIIKICHRRQKKAETSRTLGVSETTYIVRDRVLITFQRVHNIADEVQTAALIKSQPLRMAKLVKSVAQMYQPSKEPFATYLWRLEQHFSACSVIEEGGKKAKILAWLGSEAYSVLGLFCPGFEKECVYAQITAALVNYFDEEVHFVHAQVKFNRCELKPDHPIVIPCKFNCPREKGGCSLIDESIRDAIILRTPHKSIQVELLQQRNLTLEQTISISESMIMTSKTMKVIDNPETEDRVNKLQAMNTNPDRKKWELCKSCFINPSRRDCPHFQKICRRCGRLGHLQVVCQAKFPARRFKTFSTRTLPRYSKEPNISFALYGKAKDEINQLLEVVETSEWTSPIVVVPKHNGQIRICADFRVGLNSQLHVERYPIPSMDELLIKLKDMNIFSKLDLSDAYFQLPSDEESKYL